MGSSGGWEEVERVDEQTVIYQVLTEVNLPCEFKVDDITVKVGQDENKAWRVGVRMPEQKGWTWQTLPAFDPGYRHPKFPTS
jgi:hypothetical protein